jgi:alpha-tubulin suppressor-like RCC1 family protein
MTRARSPSVRRLGILGAWLLVVGCARRDVLAAPPGPMSEEICAGDQHTCARVGEQVACWGDNSWHQVAPSDEPQLETPRLLAPLPPARAVRCGAFETCVLDVAGGVHCLGGTPVLEALKLPGPARALVLDDRGGCAQLGDGKILCWSRPGRTAAGRELREVAAGSVAFAPAPPALAARGAAHGCSITSGKIQCWGAASHGQLGGAAPYLHRRPVRVPDAGKVVALDASELQACAVRHDGQVLCWGQWPEAGARLTSDFAPHEFSTLAPATEVRAAGRGAPGTAGEGHVESVCARRTSGWRCLDGRTPARSPLERLGARPRQVSRDLQCGVGDGGRLICAALAAFSSNRSSATSLLTFAPHERFLEATSIFRQRGRPYVCGRTASRRVRCFEVAESVAEMRSPSLEALADIAQIAAGGVGEDSAACALTGAGAVWCWGDGRFGQLAGPMPTDRFQAVRIPDLPAAAQLAVGGSFICSRATDGFVFCWGSNRDGTAPDGAPAAHPAPLMVRWPAP